jgi:lipopolysaccharide export system permease protein
MPRTHRILHRYVIHEFLSILGLSFSGLLLAYVVVLFFQRMPMFVERKAPAVLMVEYLLYKLPEVTFQWTLPFAVLLSTLLTLGLLSSHSEITAMKAGGVSLYRITLPLLFFSLVASACSFLGNEYLMPPAAQSAQYLLDVKVRKEESNVYFKRKKIWYRGDNQIFNIQLIVPEKNVLKGFTLYQFDDTFRCIQRVDAKEAKWDNLKWTLVDGTVRDFGANGTIETTPFKEKDFPFKETWEFFHRVKLDPARMGYGDLVAYIEGIRAAGYDSTRYVVAKHAKISYAFMCLMMVLIGIPFALKTSRSGGIAVNIVISVAIAFAYGVTFYIFISFGKSGVLPPLVAAWTPTLLFSLAGIFTLMSVRQ